MPRILVIDDDRSVLHLAEWALKDTGVHVATAASAEDGLQLLDDKPFDVVLLDVVLPTMSGLQMFELIRRRDAKLPIVFITALGTSDTAIEAMKLGAYDYLVKPLELAGLRALVARALETRRLMRDPVALVDRDGPGGEPAEPWCERLLGRSPQMLDVYKSVGRVAFQDVTVLVRGESGTGKELVARAIYQHSRRCGGPFLAVNCAAIPETLLESELFGHEKGAFTGAERMRIGKFEQCSQGTLFLDEIGDMSPLVQSKVLRVLQEQKFERVGGNETIETDVRIIAATNRDLESMVAEGAFRPDLYYRLNGYTVDLPPLRRRGDDILLLLEQFLVRFARELEKDVQGISPEALELLTSYAWPGNVRELQSVIRKALLQATGPVLVPEFLPEEVVGAIRKLAAVYGDLPPGDLAACVDEWLSVPTDDIYSRAHETLDRYLLTRILRVTGGNQSKASQMLGITRGSLRNKLHELGISIGRVALVESDGATTRQPEEKPSRVAAS